jgi:hypothetical protein
MFSRLFGREAANLLTLGIAHGRKLTTDGENSAPFGHAAHCAAQFDGYFQPPWETPDPNRPRPWMRNRHGLQLLSHLHCRN